MLQTFIKTDIKTFVIELEEDKLYYVDELMTIGLKKYVKTKYDMDDISDNLHKLVRAQIGTSIYRMTNKHAMTPQYLDHRTINLDFVNN